MGVTDISTSHLVKKTLMGITQLGVPQDKRLPISLQLLDKLCETRTKICDNYYDKVLSRTMFLLSFFAFLRIGELVVASSNDKNTLTLDNVCLDSHGKNVLISFSRFKHSKGRMHSLSIQQRTHNCPVEAFRTYISLMGAVSGYLYLDHMGKPINHLKFKTILSKYFVFLQLDPSKYTFHSFRIVATTHVALAGMSDTQIRHLGHWHSDTYKKYIRFRPSVSG